MYTALVEVLKDLWAFAAAKKPVSKASESTLLQFEKNSEQVQSQYSQPPKESYFLESRVGYVTQSHVACLQMAQNTFDTLRGVFQYGDVVKVIRQKDTWSFVESAALQGWVESKYLTDDKNEVFPILQSNQVYDADNTETKKLRQYLNDELLGGQLRMHLQPAEFILYQLKKLGPNVVWPLERPRLPGMWQSILSGKKGVSLGREPKTSSVLEHNGDTQQFLAFVESVTPDNSIIISCVGRQKAGEYEQQEFTSAQWRVWRPVFISFT
jgi:hypothetical protein